MSESRRVRSLRRSIAHHERRARELRARGGRLKLGTRPSTPCVEVLDPGERRRVRTENAARVLGPRPRGAYLLHRCDNYLCVDASHLLWGSSKHNSTDMVLKGRHARQRRTPSELIEHHLDRAASLRHSLVLLILRGG